MVDATFDLPLNPEQEIDRLYAELKVQWERAEKAELALAQATRPRLQLDDFEADRIRWMLEYLVLKMPKHVVVVASEDENPLGRFTQADVKKAAKRIQQLFS